MLFVGVVKIRYYALPSTFFNSKINVSLIYLFTETGRLPFPRRWTIKNALYLAAQRKFGFNQPVYSEKYICKFCQRSFATSAILKKHQTSYCYKNPRSTFSLSNSTKPYRCEECGAQYSLNKALTHHIKYDCGQTKQCPWCGITFSQMSGLTRHMNSSCPSIKSKKK